MADMAESGEIAQFRKSMQRSLNSEKSKRDVVSSRGSDRVKSRGSSRDKSRDFSDRDKITEEDASKM